jgi:hypothetical protein
MLETVLKRSNALSATFSFEDPIIGDLHSPDMRNGTYSATLSTDDRRRGTTRGDV